MGPELGELFHVLSNELSWLMWRWRQYVILYGSASTRLDLLNESASFFFHVIQQTLWYEVLLGIARLVGPDASMGKQNVSVRRLLPLLSGESIEADVRRLLRTAKDTSEFALEWRNRHIAHRDLDLSLGRDATPLPPGSREQVDHALGVLVAILNSIQSHFVDSTTGYNFSPSPHDAEALLHVLRDGLRREEMRHRKLESGQYDPDDWDDHLPPV